MVTRVTRVIWVTRVTRVPWVTRSLGCLGD